MDLTRSFEHMAQALFVGYKALVFGETPVSCVLVDLTTDKVISIGYNYTNVSLNGTQHAEFIAIKKIYENPDFDFATITLYVTVEPCIMCASFLRQVGIKQVYYGCGNDRFGGNGTILSVNDSANLPKMPYPSISGIMRTEAIQLLRNFYIQENDAAPQPKLKKNKGIENKDYPPNSFTVTKQEFSHTFGKEREELFDNGNKEITPILHKGYAVGDFLVKEDLCKLPRLVEELGEVTEEQIRDFSDLFYPINDDNTINFTKPVKKYNHKKRPLDKTTSTI